MRKDRITRNVLYKIVLYKKYQESSFNSDVYIGLSLFLIEVQETYI